MSSKLGYKLDVTLSVFDAEVNIRDLVDAMIDTFGKYKIDVDVKTINKIENGGE